MKKMIYLLWMPFAVSVARPQAVVDWAFELGGTNNYATDKAYFTTTDPFGNVYLTGYFTDSTDFDPGPGEAFYFSDEDDNAAFLAKYSADMELQFVITTYSGSATGTHLLIDGAGNIYWTGYFYSSVDFDPGVAAHMLSGNGGIDAFLVKYDSGGNYIWSLNAGGYYSDMGTQVLLKPDGNILLTGTFEQTVDFDPSAGEFEMTAIDNKDLFFAIYTDEGGFVSANQLNADPEGDNFDYSVTNYIDAAGNLFVAGSFSGSCDFDMNAGVTELTGISEDMFFVKYDADLNLTWVKQITGEEVYGEKEIHGITLDGDGNIYLCGWYEGDIDADPSVNEFMLNHANEGADDIFFAKYSINGDLIWAKAVGGEGYDYARSISITPEGNILICGDFYSSIDFDPGAGTAQLDAPLQEDMFIALYDENGNYLNASSLPGSDYSYEQGFSIHAADDGNIYMAGAFSQTVDFDCTAGELSVTSNGDYDIFLAKYSGIEFEDPTTIMSDEMMEITIRPNPANELLFINIDGAVNDIASITLINAAGEQVALFMNTYIIEVSDLPPGIYVAVLNINNAISTAEFMIQH